MPRFLIPIIILTIISGTVWVFILNFSSPFEILENQTLKLNHQPIAFFLVSLLVLSTSLLALSLYFSYRLLGDPLDRRSTIRRGLRQGFLISLGLVTTALLQLAQTLNPLTLILTIAVMIALEATLRVTE